MDLEDRMVRLCPEVNDAVVEPCVKQNTAELLLGRLNLLLWTIGVFNGEREGRLQAGDQVYLDKLMG